MHPQVVGWLDAAAATDRALLPLSLRRRAEQRAREGDVEGARSLAAEAIVAAAEARDPAAEALALATTGLVALYRAEYREAAAAIGEARARLAALADLPRDPEEVARVDHNLGVIALYQGRNDEATLCFERSLSVKRGLGDRAGMRSCLLNLGLALAKTGRYADADRALEESEKLARSLGQIAGRGWCLAARADVAVRRKDAAAAAGWIAEAEVVAEALPAAIRADLVILRAEVALLEGAGRGRSRPWRRSSPSCADRTRSSTRASSLAASAHLALLPVDARRAARLALAGARRARAAGLPDAEAEAIAALRAARTRRGVRYDAAPMSLDDARSLSPTSRSGRGSPISRPAPPGQRGDRAGPPPRRRARRRARHHRGHRRGRGRRRGLGRRPRRPPLAEAGARVDVELARLAASREGPVYLRDVATRGGRARASPSPRPRRRGAAGARSWCSSTASRPARSTR